MPFATNGGVSRADMSGDATWIEIPDEQYDEALAGMQVGKIVSIEGGFAMLDDHRKDDLWVAHGQRYILGEDADGQTYDGLGPVPDWLYAEEPPAPEPTLEEAQAAQLAQINRDFETAAQALTAGYPEAERLTWPIQQAEALAWAADNAAATPYLDGLADARGITPEDMRALTLAQVQAFQAASQQLVGTRQRLRDEINAAATVADVSAVVWPSGGEA